MSTNATDAKFRNGKKCGTPKAAGASDRQDLNRFPNRWIKAPAKGHEQNTGLTRPALYELARRGKIKAACIRKPGAIRGSRLFHLGSILAFLESEAEATAAREVTA